MEKIIKFQSFKNRSWTGAQKSIKRDLRSRGYNEEITKKVIILFEKFWEKYADRRGVINIPEEKAQDSKYISDVLNNHLYELRAEMLIEIYEFCLIVTREVDYFS